MNGPGIDPVLELEKQRTHPQQSADLVIGPNSE